MHHAHIDKFAYQDSPIHRLDARVKFLAAVVFTIAIGSLGRLSVSILICYVTGPLVLLVIGRVPIWFAVKKILMICPLILALALSSVFYDKNPVSVAFGPMSWEISAGWLRCFSILAKFTATGIALICLICTTKFHELLNGLSKMGIPNLLVTQLGFLYRYIFLLIDKVQHTLRACAGRRLRRLALKTELRYAGAMIGNLLVSGIDTAGRINMAMEARGFDGTVRTISKMKIGRGDYIFAALVVCFLITLHFLVRPIW